LNTNYEKKEYSFKDSAQVFLFAILMPQIIGLIFLICIVALANIFNVNYEVITENLITKIITLFLAQVGFIIVFFVYNKFKRINFFTATKMNIKVSLKQAGIIVLIAAASLFLFSPLINLIDYVISLTGYSASTTLPVDFRTVGGFIVGLISLAVLPAVFEELIFRGIVYTGLQKKFGVKFAVIFSAILFALMHTSVQQTFYQVIIGVILAYVFYLTGSLLATIILHFANNFIIIVMNVITGGAESDISFVSMGDYISVIFMTILGVIAVFILIEFLKKITEKKQQKEKIEQEHFNTSAPLQILEEVDSDSNENSIYTRYLVTGVIIAVLLWIFDFISYLT